MPFLREAVNAPTFDLGGVTDDDALVSPRASKKETKAPWERRGHGSERAAVYGAQRLTRIRGVELIRDPYLNKGTAFSERERDLLHLRGLIPPKSFPIETQLARQLAAFRKAPTDIARYLILERLHNRNETLYYRFLLEHIEEAMPIVYTPTVGQGCVDFSDMYRSRVRGLFFSKHETAHFRDICRNWPQHEIDVIVVTDGSRILGLGDLGLCGHGIPIGKLALYVAAAGFRPWRTLPITIDVGTNNETYLNSPTYIGLSEKRPADAEYYKVVDDFMRAVQWRWPKAVIQFEDFQNERAFGLLDKYRSQCLCFNDDIQGTGATALGGVLASLRPQFWFGGHKSERQQGKLRDQTLLFFGAGSAGLGVAETIAQGMVDEAAKEGVHLDITCVRKERFFLMDSGGILTAHRGDYGEMQAEKLPFCRGRGTPNILDLGEAIAHAKPTILMGIAGIPGGSFTPQVIEQMTRQCKENHDARPIIFALSNPTTKAECSAAAAYTHSDGEAIFAAGSPQPPFEFKGKTYHTGQGNNMYIFPGIGAGVVACQAKLCTDQMFTEAATRLSLMVTEEELLLGKIYPDLKRIRHISACVARGVCEVAEEQCLNQRRRPRGGWFKWVTEQMWWPQYEELV